MWSLNTRVWNDIGKAAPLRTPFGRIMFSLDTETMQQALDAIEKGLRADGVSGMVALGYLTLGPLIWERQAVRAYLDGPGGFYNIPCPEDVDGAVYIAEMEWRLDADDQVQLRSLLGRPPTVEWLASAWARAKAAETSASAGAKLTEVARKSSTPVAPSADTPAGPVSPPLTVAKPKSRRDPVVTIRAGDIATALRRTKACWVTLKFDRRKSVLTFEEAVFASFAIGIRATGSLGAEPQIEASVLARVAGKYPADTALELRAFDDDVEVRAGKSSIRLRRQDRGGAVIKRRPPPVNKKHKGKVEVVPEGRRLTPKGDVWTFTAQVPFKSGAYEPMTNFAAPAEPVDPPPTDTETPKS